MGLVIGIIALLVVFTNFTDIKYLLNIDNQYDVLPKEILQNHNATIKKIDNFIKDNNLGSITSQSKDFDLQVYLKSIQIGVIPYLKEDDSLKKEAQSLIQDISQYIEEQKKDDY